MTKRSDNATNGHYKQIQYKEWLYTIFKRIMIPVGAGYCFQDLSF
jgi:hypothetical protein